MRKFAALILAISLCMACPALADNEKTIVTSFYPIYGFAQNLLSGVEGVTIVNLAAPDAGCLHDYQLLTGDMRTLAGAWALLINGAGMESFLPDIVGQFPDLPVVDASEGIALLSENQEEDHGHEEDHDHDHDSEMNAHIWLDVNNAKQMVSNLATGLISALPEHESKIVANCDAYLARLDLLDQTIREGLQNVSRKEIVTFHEAFPYFANAYGLTVAAVVNREPGEALTPSQLKDLVNTVKTLNLPPLFIEPQYPDLAAQTLSQETGAPVYTLDPLVTGPLDGGALTAYEDGMLNNLRTLQEALGGIAP